MKITTLRPRGIAKNLLPTGLLLIILVSFFWKVIILKETYLFGDIFNFFPRRVLLAQSLKQFQIPLWTDLDHIGFPLHAEALTGIFYPLNLIFYSFLSPINAHTFSLVLHFFMAGIFTYIYARVISLEKSASLAAALVFMLSGFFISHLHDILVINGGVWLPLVLTLLHLSLKRDNPFFTILAGAVLSFPFLGGHPQIAIYSLLFSSLYLFHDIGKSPKRGLRTLLYLSLMWIICFGLAAIQLIPTYELTLVSLRRSGFAFSEGIGGYFPPQNFITMIFPYFFGKGVPGIQGSYWGRVFFWEVCCYIGILPLIFSILTLYFPKNRLIVFFLLLSLLAWMFALGNYTPVYKLITETIPGFALFRLPVKSLFLVSFSMAMLSGFGLNALLKCEESRRKLIMHRFLKHFGALSLLLLIAYFTLSVILHLGKDYFIPIGVKYLESHSDKIPKELYYQKVEGFYEKALKSAGIFNPRNLFSFFLIFVIIIIFSLWQRDLIRSLAVKYLFLAIIILDLFIFGYRYNPTDNPSDALATPESARFLKEDKSIYRIHNFSSFVPLDRQNPISGKEELQPSYNMLYGIPSTRTASPLRLKRYNDILYLLGAEPESFSPFKEEHMKLLDLLNVKYLITNTTIESEQLKLVFDKGVKIYENKKVLPRAFIVPQAKTIKEEGKILEEMKGQGYDPKNYVILEEGPPGAPVGKSPASVGQVTITAYEPRRVSIYAYLERDGYLVLSDTYYPGWKAYVDSKEEKIYRANYILRALYLKEGRHEIQFVYDPPSFRLGIYVSGLTAIGITLFSIRSASREIFALFRVSDYWKI